MSEPKFNIGQRLYNSSNEYQGKVLEAFWESEDLIWIYTIALDQPNRLNLDKAHIPENFLRATFNEAVACREEERRTLANKPWTCCSGIVEGDQCPGCKATFAEVFPDLAPYRKHTK